MFGRTDGDKPHLTYFFKDVHPLEDERLKTSEMRAILKLSGKRGLDEGHKHHTCIPVSSTYPPLYIIPIPNTVRGST